MVAGNTHSDPSQRHTPFEGSIALSNPDSLSVLADLEAHGIDLPSLLQRSRRSLTPSRAEKYSGYLNANGSISVDEGSSPPPTDLHDEDEDMSDDQSSDSDLASSSGTYVEAGPGSQYWRSRGLLPYPGYDQRIAYLESTRGIFDDPQMRTPCRHIKFQWSHEEGRGLGDNHAVAQDDEDLIYSSSEAKYEDLPKRSRGLLPPDTFIGWKSVDERHYFVGTGTAGYDGDFEDESCSDSNETTFLSNYKPGKTAGGRHARNALSS